MNNITNNPPKFVEKGPAPQVQEKPNDPFAVIEKLFPSEQPKPVTAAPLSKSQKRKIQKKTQQEAALSLSITAPVLNPDMFRLSDVSTKFTDTMFKSMAFDSTRSILEVWGLFCSKQLMDLKKIAEQKVKLKKTDAFDLISSDFCYYYYFIQLHFCKLEFQKKDMLLMRFLVLNFFRN